MRKIGDKQGVLSPIWSFQIKLRYARFWLIYLKQKVMQQHIYYIKFALRFADMQIPD